MKLLSRLLIAACFTSSLSSCGLIHSAVNMTQKTLGSVTRTITGDANDEPYIEKAPGYQGFDSELAPQLAPRELPAFTSEEIVPQDPGSN